MLVNKDTTVEQFVAAFKSRLKTEAENRLKAARKTAENVAVMRENGFSCSLNTEYGSEYCVCNVRREDLPRIRRLIGRLRLHSKDISNPEDNTIQVTLCPADNHRFLLQYTTTLKDTDRCRIEYDNTPRAQLVCSV